MAIDFAGPGVPADMIANAYLFIGDPSFSNSEIWSMNVGGQTITSSDYGVVERVEGKFKRGESYDVTVSHVSTISGEPDYDYRAWIDRYANPTWTSGNPIPSSVDFFVTDPGQLFQRQFLGNSINATFGKTATVHFPAIDLDIDSGNSGLVDSSHREDTLETDTTTGARLRWYNGDSDGDGVSDRFDFNGIAGGQFQEIKVSLSSNLGLLANATTKIKFEFDDAGSTPSTTKLFRIWRKDAPESRTAADLIRSGVEYDASELGLQPGETSTFYLEAVNETRRTVHYDPIKVTKMVTSSTWSGVSTDVVHASRLRTAQQDHCVFPQQPDGQIRAVDDRRVFIELNLADAGPQSVPVMDNDEFDNIYGSSYSLTATNSGGAEEMSVFGIGSSSTEPLVIANPDQRYYWWASTQASGSFEWGSIELNLSFWDVEYYLHRPEGAYHPNMYAGASYIGTMTLNLNDGTSRTLPVGYSLCMEALYGFIEDDGDLVVYGGGKTKGFIGGSTTLEDGSPADVLVSVKEHNARGYIHRPTQEDENYSLSGDISSNGAYLSSFTQPRFGTAEKSGQSMVYTPDPDRNVKEDSFDYTISNLFGQSDDAKVTMLAIPDRVKVTSSDAIASEVPGNQEFDTAKIKFSRQRRSEADGGNNHSTLVYYSVSVPDEDTDESRYLARLSDWHYQGDNNWSSVGNSGNDPVFLIVIPGESANNDGFSIERTILAALDSQFEADEALKFTVVDRFTDLGGTEVRAKYEVEGSPAELTIKDKTADIDFEHVDDFEEDDPGISLNQTLEGGALHRVTIRSHIPAGANYGDADFFTIAFNQTTAGFWFRADKSNERDANGNEIPGTAQISTTTRFNEDESHTIWMEVIAEHLGVDNVSLIWHRDESSTVVQQTDSFTYTTWNIDLDVDSDNNGVVQRSAWEDYLEVHPYAFGKVLQRTHSTIGYFPEQVLIQLPRNLAPFETDLKTLKFDLSSLFEPHAGKVILFTSGMATIIQSGYSYSLDELGYNPLTGMISLEMIGIREAFEDDGTPLTTLGQLRRSGKPMDGIITVSGVYRDRPLKDSVRFIVSRDPSIFFEILNRQEVRASFAAKAVYDFNDLPNYGLEQLSESRLRELGLDEQVLGRLNNGRFGAPGFKAALYQDYSGAPNRYILAFAGTDFDGIPFVDDMINNFSQGAVAGSPQYNSAFLLSGYLADQIASYKQFGASAQVITAGHSLGGGLATAASVWRGLTGYGFNASGLSIRTVQQANYDLAANNNEVAVDRWVNAASYMTQYYDPVDILNVLQDATPLIPRARGLRVPINGPHSAKPKMLEAKAWLQNLVATNLNRNANGQYTWDGAVNWEWYQTLWNSAESFVYGIHYRNELKLMGDSHSYYQSNLLGRLYGEWLNDDGSPDPKKPMQ